MSNHVSLPHLRPARCQLPVGWYFDPEIFALEKKRLFDAGSGYVGHRSEERRVGKECRL